jgi:hypothetical protein
MVTEWVSRTKSRRPASCSKLADVLADSRLAQAETFGGLGEAPGLGDRKESPKQDGFEHVRLS